MAESRAKGPDRGGSAESLTQALAGTRRRRRAQDLEEAGTQAQAEARSQE